MKNTKRILALVLVMVMAAALMAGCGTAGSGSSASTPATEAPASSSSATEPTQAPETDTPDEPETGLPLVEEAATLTMWDTFNPTVLSYIDGWSEHPVLKEVYDMTNVYIEAVCVPGNKGADAFQLLLAGEEYYDIMSSFDNFYTGGIDQAIDDEVILNLTDLINEYAPDYLAAIAEQDCMKDCTTNNGNMGVFFSGVDFIDTMAAEGIELVALPEPTLNGTDKIHTVQPNSAKARAKFCITTECEDPELAVRFLNVFFQKDIAELCDYGIEGQAYTMENGERKFTDLLLNNPDGLASGNARRIYCVDDWCFYQNKGRDLYFYSDKGVEATQVFADQMDYTMAMPLGLSLTADEADIFSTRFAEISTYALESIANFVLGDKNLESDWDEYVAQLEAMGSKDITEVYQSAYDRYMSK